MKNFKKIRLFGIAVLPAAVFSSATAQTPSAPATPPVNDHSKLREFHDLKAEAKSITDKIGDLAKSGNLPTSDESIALLKKLVEELEVVNHRLAALESDVDLLKKGGSSKQDSEKMQKDLDKLKKLSIGGYAQFQYRNSNNFGIPDGFTVRRAEFGLKYQINDQAFVKFSDDFATSTNQLGSTLKDMFMSYTASGKPAKSGGPDPGFGEIPGLQFIAGQVYLPLGNELPRSASEIDFPEKSVYNQKMFNGERGRGIMINKGLSDHVYAQAGIWNPLSVTDPEQAGVDSATQNSVAGTLGLRAVGDDYSLGISGFGGNRRPFTTGSGATAVTSPAIARQFLYLDGTWGDLHATKKAHKDWVYPRLSFRGEVMVGKDRVPGASAVGATATASDMTGFTGILGYNFGDHDELRLKWEQFDPDKKVGGDLLNGWGLSYSKWLTDKGSSSQGIKLTAAYEIFQDDARIGINQRRYNLVTIRVQYKF